MASTTVKHVLTEEQDEIKTWIFQQDAFRPCPHCAASPKFQELRNYMALWKDAMIFCNACDKYIKEWDEEVPELL